LQVGVGYRNLPAEKQVDHYMAATVGVEQNDSYSGHAGNGILQLIRRKWNTTVDMQEMEYYSGHAENGILHWTCRKCSTIVDMEQTDPCFGHRKIRSFHEC
jgi:hypothetical protein